MNWNMSDPIWFLRGGLTAAGASIVFFWMGYTEPTMRPFAYGFAALQLVGLAVFAWLFWYWPRSSIQRRGEDG